MGFSRAAHFKIGATVALAALAVGCTSPLTQRAQRADGLLDFLAGNYGETNVPVEIVSGGGGFITSAHVRAYRNKVFVSGLVGGNPSRGAHVDVLVLNAQGKVLEAIAEDYNPRDIPHGQRSGFQQSRYTARLAAQPSAGSTVKAVLHNAPKSKCEFAMNR